jgi:hypothetical protein
MGIKKSLFFLFFSFLMFWANAQPGKPASPAGRFAGSKKLMIGKVYSVIDSLSGLKGWTMVEGGLANSLNDPEHIMSHVFRKGTTYLVLYSINEDTASSKYTVTDVLEITGVLKGWTIRSSFCRLNKVTDNYLIAWGRENIDEFMKLIKKAWRFNPDKRRIELIPIKEIDCENIGC